LDHRFRRLDSGDLPPTGRFVGCGDQKLFLAPFSPASFATPSTSLVNKKLQPLLIIDEASLLRLDVFAELHTLCQFEADSKPHLPVILAGQNNLLDLLQYRSSLPLASRIVATSHLEGIDLEQMQRYLAHHLSIAGVKTQLFSAQAITAIQQGSAGLLRRANHLAPRRSDRRCQ
jgi:type II secretory pathway predicted ATPase ExeA